MGPELIRILVPFSRQQAYNQLRTGDVAASLIKRRIHHYDIVGINYLHIRQNGLSNGTIRPTSQATSSCVNARS